MRITIVLAVSLLSAWTFLTSCGSALAQAPVPFGTGQASTQSAQINVSEIGQSRIHPAHPLYFLKTIREILELKFAGTSNIRGLRHLEFTQRRIREVKSLVSVNHQELIPPTLENYWFNLEKVRGLLSFKDEVLANQVFDQIKRQLIVLQKLYDQLDDARAKMAIRTAIYRISGWHTQILDKSTIQALACNFLSKEASSSGLNEVEKAVLLERAKKCRRVVYPKEP